MHEQGLVTPETIREALLGLQGVMAARVLLDENGQVDKIEAVVLKGRPPKDVVRDIETLLAVRFDVRVDYRKISLSFDDVLVGGGTRLKIRGIHMREHERTADVKVELESGEECHSGAASGPLSVQNRWRLLATATLAALESYLQQSGRFSLDYAGIVDIGGSRAAVTVLEVIGKSREEVLAGSSLVKSDEAEAVVRSVLDAVNRRLPRLGASDVRSPKSTSPRLY